MHIILFTYYIVGLVLLAKLSLLSLAFPIDNDPSVCTYRMEFTVEKVSGVLLVAPRGL